MNGLVNEDRRDWEFCSIDTESWLAEVTDEEITDQLEEKGVFDGFSGHWMSDNLDAIKDFLDESTGLDWSNSNAENVYNSENDFSSVFEFSVFYRTDDTSCGEWYYSNKDVIIAVQIHQGGDVRGNYGPVRFFRGNNLSETGFLDWCLGWSTQDSHDERQHNADQFDVGYSQNPSCHLGDNLKNRALHWSNRHDCFVGWLWDDVANEYRVTKAWPECRAGY